MIDIYTQKEWLVDNGFYPIDSLDGKPTWMKTFGITAIDAKLVKKDEISYVLRMEGTKRFSVELTFKETKTLTEIFNKLI